MASRLFRYFLCIFPDIDRASVFLRNFGPQDQNKNFKFCEEKKVDTVESCLNLVVFKNYYISLKVSNGIFVVYAQKFTTTF